MKITRCKYGHYYDKAYFRECPHCCQARGGRDEDIIIGRNSLSTDLTGKTGEINWLQGNGIYNQDQSQDRSINQREQDRKKVERWIGEAWDELEEILSEEDSSSESVSGERKKDIEESFLKKTSGEEKKNIQKRDEERRVQRQTVNTEKRVRENGNSGRVSSQRVGRKELEKVEKVSEKTKVTEAVAQEEKQEDKRKKIAEEKNTVSVKEQHRNSEQNLDNYMLFAAMPLKVMKNQEFCMDFCIFPEKDWEAGAKMLSFKSQESIRDLKPVQMALPAKTVLHILYKEEEIFHKEIQLEQERGNVFCTFPVTVTDTRDRRFHMIKAVFEIEEQNIEIPLYLMPNP